MEGCRDDEPSLSAPENSAGSQVLWLCGGNQDHEVETPDTTLPDVVAALPLETVVLPWRGRSTVLAAAGTLILGMLEWA